MVSNLIHIRLPDINAKVAGELVRAGRDAGVVAGVIAAGPEAGGHRLVGPGQRTFGWRAAALLVDVIGGGDGEGHAVAGGGDAGVGGAEGGDLEVESGGGGG